MRKCANAESQIAVSFLTCDFSPGPFPNLLLNKKMRLRPPWVGVSRTWRQCSPSSFCSGWRWQPSPPPSTSSPSRRRRCLRSEIFSQWVFPYSPLLILPRHCMGFFLKSRQSARPFLQFSELGSPTPSPAGECVPPPSVGSGGGHTQACGEGVRGPNSEEGAVWNSRYMYFVGSYIVFWLLSRDTVHCNTNIRRATALSSSLYL